MQLSDSYILPKSTDVDECSMGLDNCHFNAVCSNTEDGFTCTCESGYTGNGTDCTSESFQFHY